MTSNRGHENRSNAGRKAQSKETSHIDFNSNQRRVESGLRKSRVVKRSLVVGGHKTSVSLEDIFWDELRAIAQRRQLHLSQLVGMIDAGRQHCNLSSAIRVFVFEQCRASAVGDDRERAGY